MSSPDDPSSSDPEAADPELPSDPTAPGAGGTDGVPGAELHPSHPFHPDLAAGAAAPRTGIGRPHLSLLIGPIIALVIASNVANAFFPTLSTEYPLLLIALSSANRNLILASGQIPFVPYFLVATVRLLAPDVLFYLLGYHYGERALGWMEHRTPRVGVLMHQLEDLFARFGWAIVVFFPLIIPSNPVCLIAGAARMRPRVFWALNAIGIVGRVLIMLWLGDVFGGAVEWLLGFISDYRLPLTVVTVGLVGFTAWREMRTGTSEIQQLLELEDELEPESEPGGSDRP